MTNRTRGVNERGAASATVAVICRLMSTSGPGRAARKCCPSCISSHGRRISAQASAGQSRRRSTAAPPARASTFAQVSAAEHEFEQVTPEAAWHAVGGLPGRHVRVPAAERAARRARGGRPRRRPLPPAAHGRPGTSAADHPDPGAAAARGSARIPRRGARPDRARRPSSRRWRSGRICSTKRTGTVIAAGSSVHQFARQQHGLRIRDPGDVDGGRATAGLTHRRQPGEQVVADRLAVEPGRGVLAVLAPDDAGGNERTRPGSSRLGGQRRRSLPERRRPCAEGLPTPLRRLPTPSALAIAFAAPRGSASPRRRVARRGPAPTTPDPPSAMTRHAAMSASTSVSDAPSTLARMRHDQQPHDGWRIAVATRDAWQRRRVSRRWRAPTGPTARASGPHTGRRMSRHSIASSRRWRCASRPSACTMAARSE